MWWIIGIGYSYPLQPMPPGDSWQLDHAINSHREEFVSQTLSRQGSSRSFDLQIKLGLSMLSCNTYMIHNN